ncbi:unnamed protein product [Zymoseptoria tritici ST99CH_1A5]|uniref:Aminoglycoside phosphotransferase domain-containing protein n=1 Tax=Zymoseptoria tritici ST99CH_1A5 TaxID=1276529 RepID=A0A1Y6M2Z5_ZYMTR|nr:unnamed protein product [Zymoseptoria tritici ST99CH_1A5]
MILSRHNATDPDVPCWSDGSGNFFKINELSDDHEPGFKTPRDEDTVPLVHHAGDVHAVWKVGTAYLKVMIPATPLITREHITLQALQQRRCPIEVPRVIYHGEWDGRYYLIITEVPGITLDRAWPSMGVIARDDCVAKVTKLCKDLAALMGSSARIAGIDGSHLAEYFLGTRSGKEWNFDPEIMKQRSIDRGMDCSALTFYHCDLGPNNILIRTGPTGVSIGVIDWECAGFVPASWIRTKFILAGGMDFEIPGGSKEARQEWRIRMEEALGQDGFKESLKSWQAWSSSGASS